MPESEPLFNNEEFFGVLARRGVKRDCLACGSTATRTSDHLVRLRMLDADNNIKPDGGYAAAVLACDNCGYLHLFVPALVEGYGWTAEESAD